MKTTSATKPIIQINGNVRFRAATGPQGPHLSAESLSALADYLNSKDLIKQIEDLADFCDSKNISIPVLLVRSGSTEISIQSSDARNTSGEVEKKLPWYRRPLLSLFK